MGWRVLVAAPYLQPVIERFRPSFDEHRVKLYTPPDNERVDKDHLHQLIVDKGEIARSDTE